MSSQLDVVIIGAGAAGLSAAQELDSMGISYRVVEGSHRIGGRAYSEEIAPGVWFDLGCSYLHQAQVNPFVGIADQLGIAIGKDKADLFDDHNMKLYGNGVALDADQRQAYFAYYERCYASMKDSAQRGEDVAVAELVDLEHEYALSFMHFMAELNAVDIDATSNLDFVSSDGGPDVPVLNGYGNLVAAWGADVAVELNTRVERVNWSGREVRIETARGDLRARAALCTVSTGILAAGDIDFTPALPDWKMEAIAGVPTGIENKTCLHFDRDVFGPQGRGFHKTWNDAGEACGFEASVMGQNTAIVFSGGRFAAWLEKQGQQAGHDYAVDRVAEVFGNDIRKRVTRSIVTAWAGEPWTRGSYSAALPGQAHQREQLAKPLDECLFFAGEATTVGAQACCHGAYRSGIRAAREIGEALD
ncbi:MAG: FAD-dependent oxidoreductase [Gammaproteobacteria bacterium]|nr:FAD-dependent oxidoreductase [Gammaproteobacteria bacterium]